MREKLEALRLRLDGGNYTLSSGIKTKVKWDIERLYWGPGCGYPDRIWAIKEWADRVKEINPQYIHGIPKGGRFLAIDLIRHSGLRSPYNVGSPAVLVDDVLTTGTTLRNWLAQEANKTLGITHIAVLINRSNPPITEIDGIPIITGIFADPVECDNK